MPNYSQQWSSATPGLMIILIDQSGSMEQQIAGGDGKSKADFAALVINRVLKEIILKSTSGTTIKDRCFVSIIGYGSHSKEVRSDYISKLSENPIRIDVVKKKVSDGAGGLVEVEEQQPIWLESEASGLTDMGGALYKAKDVISSWITQYPDRPAPVLINVSDGLPTDATGNQTAGEANAIAAAKAIMSLPCKDGSPLIFNAHISEDGGSKITFPDSPTSLSTEAKFIWEISSEIPEGYKPAAAKHNLNVSPGARGCMFNADGVDLIMLMDFGSSKGQADRAN